MFQDNDSKMKQVMLKLTIDLNHLQERDKLKAYEFWCLSLKKSQRPIWVDPAILSCFICEGLFSLMERQHHCRKCGTAVCARCSNYKQKLPELAY